MSHVWSGEPRPYFTVIIPTYERHAMLAEAVESVRAQSYSNWELLILDDASPTPVLPFDDSRVTVIRNETNLGKAASANRALGLARGVAIAFLDDDDVWTPERLAHAREEHQHADVVVCLGGRMGVEGSDSAWCLRMRRWRQLRRGHEHGPIAIMGATSVRRETAPLFDPNFLAAEDVDWAIRLWQRTTNVRVVAHEDFLWRCHDGPRHLNGDEARLRGNLQLLEKHYDYYKQNSKALSSRLTAQARRLFAAGDKDSARRVAREAASASLSWQAAKVNAKVELERAARLLLGPG